MSKDSFDVIVIGGGPAGYHAAIRCAQLGMSTACIDKSVNEKGSPTLGGTCLNWGCIPSKTLLDVSHKYHEATADYDGFGIEINKPKINIKKMMAFKDGVINKLTGGISALMQANKVEVFHGTAQLGAEKKVIYQKQGKGKKTSLHAQHIILAPGSLPTLIPASPLVDSLVVDSSGALEFSKVPKNLGIIGAGVIGLELGSVWARLGSKVTILEAMNDFLPMADERIARDSFNIFKKQGLAIHLGAKVLSSKQVGKEVEVSYSDKSGEHNITFDKLVVAVGRRPCTRDLLAQGCSLKLDQAGFIEVDELCQTNLSDVYAIGDAVRGPMLAHKGMEEGLMVADRLAGKPSLVNYTAIPNVIYTTPEIAWVGQTEAVVKESGIPYKIGSFAFAANGRALAAKTNQGIVKIVAHADTDRILGLHILGPQASELIAQAVSALEFNASVEDIALTMCAHPTLSEVLHEAAMAVNNEAVHVVNKKLKR